MKDNMKIKTSKIAIGSFVAGITPLVLCGATLLLWEISILGKALGFLFIIGFPFFTGALALALGVIALISIKQSNGIIKGKAWAIMGVILGPCIWLVYIISDFID